ncbi:hypothetical protein ACJA3G_01660, partial [Streptomyces sp. YS-3]
MSQQGERRTSDDDWWARLYDEPAPDSAPATAGDTLDDRFKSVARAVSPPVPDPRSPQAGPPPYAPGGAKRPTTRDGVAPADPADLADSADPADPTDPADPADPAYSTGLGDPADLADSADLAYSTGLGDPRDPADPTAPADPADVADPT